MASRGGRRSFGRIRRLKSGHFQAGYVGPDGHVHYATVTFLAKIDAEAWLSEEHRLIERDEWTNPKARREQRTARGVAFGEYARSWVAARTVRGRPLRPRTVDHYLDLLDRQLAPFADMSVTAIDRADVEAWHTAEGDGTPVATAHAYSLLRAVLASAVDYGIIPTNPCHIRGAGTSPRRHHVEPLTIPELRTLVAAMPEQYQLLVLLASWCALRFGELAELRRKDISLSSQTIRVRRGVVRVDGQVIVGPPKSDAGIRDVAIPPHLTPLVREHLVRFAQRGREGLVFPSESGIQLSPSTIYGEKPHAVKRRGNPVEWRGGANFYRARALAGHPDMHFHDLRHTGAVLAAQTGATLAELMARLGHSTPSAAMRYQHAARDRDADIAAKLSDMMEVDD